MQKIKKSLLVIVRWIVIVLCGVVLGVNIYSMNAGRLVGDHLPMPFGYGAAVVLSGSMEPEFSVDDLIVVKKTDDFEERDIVVFQSNGSLVVHRVIQIDGDTVTTQGDANNTPDEPIERKNVKGVVLFHVPKIGLLVHFMQSPIGSIIVSAVAILLVEIPRRRERQKDAEELDKIKEEIRCLKDEL